MATEVKLPRLGQGMESGTIVRWLKTEGEPVKKREPLYELDTDKVTQEVEAEADGVLLKIVVPEGEVEVGTTVAVIGAAGRGRLRAPRGRQAATAARRGAAPASQRRRGGREPRRPRRAAASRRRVPQRHSARARPSRRSAARARTASA